MSDKKIIIRNCPAIYQNFEDEFVCTSQIKVKSFPFYCQDCTDCLLKQIVKRCKKVRECTADICTNPYEYATYCEIRGVLQLLDIQEIK